MNIDPDEEVIAAFQRDYPAEAEMLYHEGIEAERTRILDLLKLSHPATSAIINRAIQNGDEATTIFHAVFKARECAGEGGKAQPNRNNASRAAAQQQKPVQSAVPQPRAVAPVPSSSSSESFASTLRKKLGQARACWIRSGRERRLALEALS